MRFDEGCYIASIELVHRANAVDQYIDTVFNLAKRVPLYLTVHPTTIVISVRGVRRRVAVAPGSAIVCSDEGSELRYTVELTEPTWIDAELLIPLISEECCSYIMEYVGVDPEVGLRARRVSEVSDLESVVEGGVACVEGGEEVCGRISIALKFSKFFLLWKALGSRGDGRARIEGLEVGGRLRLFLDEAARIGDKLYIAQVGRGIAVLGEPLNDSAKRLVKVALLSALTLPPDSPRARAYMHRLGVLRI